MGTIPLDMAIQQTHQTLDDLSRAIDEAVASDRVIDRLTMTTCLTALRYIEKNGLTDGGRRQLNTAIECCRSVLGIHS